MEKTTEPLTVGNRSIERKNGDEQHHQQQQ